MDVKETSKELVLEEAITAAVKVPGVKVDRKKFISEQFFSFDNLTDIVEFGPVEAGVTEEELSRIAGKLIITRTSQSSLASFVAGIPGGLAMAATVPADVLQFFGMALRLAQELSYLYGAQDLWVNGQIDDEKVRSQLIMYCGVMFGVSGAVSGVRVLSTQIAKTTLKKLPQKALTKTFWYPIVKQIGKTVGVKVTKSTVAKGVSKAIPVIGGVISGGLNFASMMPMAKRLEETLNKSVFHYSEEEFYTDIETIENISDEEPEETSDTFENIKGKVTSGIKGIGSGASKLASKFSKKQQPAEDPVETLKQMKELLDLGIVTQEEFDMKKKELLGL